jgi:hypothetical protein
MNQSEEISAAASMVEWGEVLVSITNDATEPWIHIRQVKGDLGVMSVNTDGLILRFEQLAQLMRQLRSFEDSFMNYCVPEGSQQCFLYPLFEEQADLLHQQQQQQPVETTLEQEPGPSVQHRGTQFETTLEQEPGPSVQHRGTQCPISVKELESATKKKKKNVKVTQPGEKKKMKMKKIDQSRKDRSDDLKLQLSQARVLKRNFGADDVAMAFAMVLRRHIETIINSRCLGCRMNKGYDKEGHDMCNSAGDYVEEFFDEAMAMLQQYEVELEFSKRNPTTPCPLKTEMVKDKAWCRVVQNVIISLC